MIKGRRSGPGASRLGRFRPERRRFLRARLIGAVAAAAACISVLLGPFASAVDQNCGAGTGSTSGQLSSSSSRAESLSLPVQSGSSQSVLLQTIGATSTSENRADTSDSLVSLLGEAQNTSSAASQQTSDTDQAGLTSLLLNQSQVSQAQVDPQAASLTAGSAGSSGGEAEAGDCRLTFDLETGASGNLDISLRAGSSGDAFGGDAIGGSSTAVASSGDVVVGGNGGPGGSAGGSGAYAGAVIGNNSSGGGGNGGNGGPAICIGGPTGPGGRSCASGDVTVISGNGGNATGGDATSGDGGDAGVESSGTGDTGTNNIR